MRRSQTPHLTEIERLFSDLGIGHAPVSPNEITGLPALRAFGESLYGDNDPLTWPRRPPRTVAENAGGLFKLPLPVVGMEREDVHLARSARAMLVTLGPYRRSIDLPDHLLDRQASGARFEDGQLVVEFADD